MNQRPRMTQRDGPTARGSNTAARAPRVPPAESRSGPRPLGLEQSLPSQIHPRRSCQRTRRGCFLCWS
jgi:hypothetical protein